jgi:stage II sporulation protein R
MESAYEIARPGRGRVRSPHGEERLARRRLGQAFLAVLVLIFGLVAWSGWRLRADTAYNTHNLIRLHVVANSDQPKDQEVKLEVRDAILNASGSLFAGKTLDDAVLAVKDNLPLFKRIAENVLAASGYDYPVGVEYGAFAFPERTYGPLVLPAGNYQALRVVLGSGEGANWWCILFPPLCYLDVVGGGGRSEEWGITAGGTLTAGTAGRAGGVGAAGQARSGTAAATVTRVVSLDSLTDAQLRDLESVLQRALDRVPKPTTSATDEGVRVIISDVPSSPDTDLVVLVANTGSNRTEVRFYVFDRLRDLLRSLAISAPWLVESLPGGGAEGAGLER